MKFVSKALNLSEPAARRLFRRSILKKAFIPHPFFLDVKDAYLLEKKFGKFESGTFIAQLAKNPNDYVIARGFPKIKRSLMLKETIKTYFKNVDVSIEEKINGYNVRILKIGDNLYAITRRGYICPYTTEKVREQFDFDFFKDFPEMMLCCEAAGLESPYVPKKIYGKRLKFYLFDVRNSKTNEALNIYEKIKISEEYNFKIANIFCIESGEELIESAYNTIKKLDKEGREGIVLKDVSMQLNPVKYTTSSCNCSDLKYAFKFFNDYGKDFLVTRAVREGFQSYEFDSEKEKIERYCNLGKAIIEGVISGIKEVKDTGWIKERFRLRFTNPDVIELFKEHIKRLTNARLSEPIIENGNYIIYMDKKVKSTSDRIRNLINGGFW